jgi:hypothetical protein
LRRRSERQNAAACGGVRANSGCAVQRAAKSWIVPRPARGALVGVGDPGRGGDEDEAAHALGVGERHVEGDPSAHRVAAEHEALGGGGRHVGHAVGEGDRAAVARRAVAAEVDGQRPVAFPVQPVGDEVPAVARAREPV